MPVYFATTCAKWVQAVIADMTPARFGLDGDGGIRYGLHPFGCWLSVLGAHFSLRARLLSCFQVI
jgi:hypothetical protein